MFKAALNLFLARHVSQTALTGLDIKLLYALTTMLNIIRRMPSITKEPVRTMVWACNKSMSNLIKCCFIDKKQIHLLFVLSFFCPDIISLHTDVLCLYK